MASEGPAQPVAQPEFHLWREVDRLDKRIDRAFLQLDELDQHGSRGVDGLRIEVANLRADFAAHERAHEREVAERRTARRWGLGLGITAAVALVGPVYPLLLLLLERPPH